MRAITVPKTTFEEIKAALNEASSWGCTFDEKLAQAGFENIVVWAEAPEGFYDDGLVLVRAGA